MFRFAHGEYLYLLLLLPLIAVAYGYARRQRRHALAQFGNPELLTRQTLESSRVKPLTKLLLWLLALAFFIVGWANPQMGSKRETVRSKGFDLLLALDVSQSMMAEDVTPNRLDRARRLASDLIGELRGNRMGLIIFAGSAYLAIPLTSDYGALVQYLRSVSTDMLSAQGTNFAGAIDLAAGSFSKDNQHYKALVVISDGENHEDGALEAARNARDDGMVILTVGVGTAEGSFVPIALGPQRDYKRDEAGNPVRSKLEETLLQDLAKAGDGAYFRLGNNQDDLLEPLRKELDRVEKREVEQRVFSEYESYYQWFIGLGLLILLIESFITYRRSKYFAPQDWIK